MLARRPPSPSQLAETLANIRLEDVTDTTPQKGDSYRSPSSLDEVTRNVESVSSGLDAIRSQFFVIEEKRHAGVFALLDTSSPSKGDIDATANIALDAAMVELNSHMETVSDLFTGLEAQMESLDENTVPRPENARRNSTSSISSMDSFDDALGIQCASHNPAVLRKKYANLAQQWLSVQKEAKNIEQELSNDKYNQAFDSISTQMEEMMQSLDKALASCHDFVFAYNQDRSQKAMQPEFSLQARDAPWSDDDERRSALRTVKQSFLVKRASYGPACEQMFSSLEKGMKQRGTLNGTVLRRFSELKSRWKTLRERIARMDKELKRIEVSIQEPSVSLSPSTHTPNRASLLGTSVPRSSPLVADRTPSKLSSSRSNTDARSPYLTPPAHARPGARGSSLSPHASSLPSKNRQSMLEMHRSPIDKPRHHEHARTSSMNSPVLRVLNAKASASPSDRHHQKSPSLSPAGPLGQSLPKSLLHPYAADQSLDSSAEFSLVEDEETLMSLGEGRPTSPSPFYRPHSSLSGATRGESSRPPSAAGLYYRPPSSTSQRPDTESRIPRLSSATPRRSSISAERPGSALSYASTQSPRASRIRAPHPPTSYTGDVEDRSSALRASMQTPEPTILARVQRMSLFGGASAKRSSRPPPSRYNANSYTPNHRSSASASNASPMPNTQPLHKRSSQIWSSNGRTTPLSAAALAKIPHAQPTLDGFETPQRRVPSSTARAPNGSRVPSIRSGRATPTYSDGGQSSVWGAKYTAGGRSSRLGSQTGDLYRANPNDAIDVEVARVANALGVPIERVDPPLPRGVKELDPKSTTLVRYQVGGKVITCKLLQLVSVEELCVYVYLVVVHLASSRPGTARHQSQEDSYACRRRLD